MQRTPSNNHKVSIIVTIYNSEKTLEKTLTSIFNQELEDVQFVLVNDSSTDGSDEIVKRYLKNPLFKEKDIVYISNERNLGAGGSKQIGIEAAKGEYVLTVDSDDWIDPKTCTLLYNKAKKEQADIVIASCYYTESKNKTSLVKIDPLINKSDISDCLLDIAVNGTVPSFLPIHFISKKFIGNTGLKIPQNLNLLEDKWFLIRLYFEALKVCTLHYPFAHLRIDNPSITRSDFSQKKADDLKWFYETTKQFLILKKIPPKQTKHFFAMQLSLLFSFAKGAKYTTWANYISPEVNKVKFVRYISATPAKKIAILTCIVFGGRFFSLIEMSCQSIKRIIIRDK